MRTATRTTPSGSNGSDNRRIDFVAVTVEEQAYDHLEKLAAAAFAVD